MPFACIIKTHEGRFPYKLKPKVSLTHIIWKKPDITNLTLKSKSRVDANAQQA
jgi:hypothetical protein